MKKLLLGLLLAAFASSAQAQNYTATLGAGSTFGAKLVSTVLYPQFLMCDPATPANCVAVNASGQITVLQGASPWQVQSNSANIATQTTLASVLTALGSPFQAGGSVGNTGFNALQGGAANAVGNPFFVSPGTGAVFGSSAAASAYVDGWDVTEGTKTDSPAAVPTSATSASVVALLKALINVGQYPAGAVAITASATGTTAATTATLAGTVGKTTYICSYSIRANATAATTVQNTITGVVTATMTHQMWVAPAASGIGVDEQVFNPCVPASATNTGIAVVSGAPGAGGLVSATAAGYQL